MLHWLPRFQRQQHRVKVGLEHLTLEQKHRNLRGLQHIIELWRGRKSAQRHRHAARQRYTEQRRKELGPVGHQDADPRVLAHAAADQRAGDFERTGQQIVVAPRNPHIAAAQHHRLADPVAADNLAQIAADGQRPDARLLRQRHAMRDRKGLTRHASLPFGCHCRAMPGGTRPGPYQIARAIVHFARECRCAIGLGMRATTTGE